MTLPTLEGEWGLWDLRRCISIAEPPGIARPKVTPVGSDVQKPCPLSRVGGVGGGTVAGVSVYPATGFHKGRGKTLPELTSDSFSLLSRVRGVGDCTRCISVVERKGITRPSAKAFLKGWQSTATTPSRVRGVCGECARCNSPAGLQDIARPQLHPPGSDVQQSFPLSKVRRYEEFGGTVGGVIP